MQTINDQWIDTRIENCKRTISVKVRGFEKDEDGKSTGKLLFEHKTDATFVLDGITFGRLINHFVIPHARVIAQNKYRDLGEDVVKEMFAQPILLTDLEATQRSGSARTVDTVANMSDEVFDEFMTRIVEIRKAKAKSAKSGE